LMHRAEGWSGFCKYHFIVAAHPSPTIAYASKVGSR